MRKPEHLLLAVFTLLLTGLSGAHLVTYAGEDMIFYRDGQEVYRKSAAPEVIEPEPVFEEPVYEEPIVDDFYEEPVDNSFYEEPYVEETGGEYIEPDDPYVEEINTEAQNQVEQTLPAAGDDPAASPEAPFQGAEAEELEKQVDQAEKEAKRRRGMSQGEMLKLGLYVGIGGFVFLGVLFIIIKLWLNSRKKGDKPGSTEDDAPESGGPVITDAPQQKSERLTKALEAMNSSPSS